MNEEFINPEFNFFSESNLSSSTFAGMKILALSSSRSGNSNYLEPAFPFIKELFGAGHLHFAFIPFATACGYQEYHQKVKEGLASVPFSIDLVTEGNAKELIKNAEGIIVGGGNTFKLLHDLYAQDLIELIREKVRGGTPYIGWSAGANILGATIGTTNDMPIIQPKSFEALNIFPFQINPHYHNEVIPGFNGETRDQRIIEFLRLNTSATVIGMPEGSALLTSREKTIYRGEKTGFHFYFDNEVKIQEIKDRIEILIS